MKMCFMFLIRHGKNRVCYREIPECVPHFCNRSIHAVFCNIHFSRALDYPFSLNSSILMKRILPVSFFALCAIVLLGFSVSCIGVQGSGKIVTEKRALSGFTAIEAGGAIDLEISQSDSYSVEVSADDNILPKIITNVDGETLRIERKGEDFFTSSTVHVKISLPKLTAVELSGASEGIAKNITSDKLHLEVSGASKFLMSGKVSELHSEVSGASKLEAKDLVADNAEIECSGASKAHMHATSSLKISAEGASKVLYSGTPRIIEESSGASSIAQE